MIILKIERVSENKIRCTLNKSDLEEKQIMISELAYGSEKARELFAELMHMAEEEVGFEVDSTPIMIEAIPDRSGNLILNITKVENPEELDSKFSRFAGDGRSEQEYDEGISEEDKDISNTGILQNVLSEDEESKEDETLERANNLNSFIQELRKNLENNAADVKVSPVNPATNDKDERKAVFAFKNMRDVISAARLVRTIYHSTNSLYKNENDGKLYLFVECDFDRKQDFVKTCSVLSEFAAPCRFMYATKDFFAEHFKTIRKDNALQILSTL